MKIQRGISKDGRFFVKGVDEQSDLKFDVIIGKSNTEVLQVILEKKTSQDQSEYNDVYISPKFVKIKWGEYEFKQDVTEIPNMENGKKEIQDFIHDININFQAWKLSKIYTEEFEV